MVLGPAVPVVVLAAEAKRARPAGEKRERQPPERRVAPAVPEDAPSCAGGVASTARSPKIFTAPTQTRRRRARARAARRTRTRS